MKPLLTPKLDFVFKLLFTQDAEILADLISSVLDLPEKRRILSAEVKNPVIVPEELTKKIIALDIRATDGHGRHYDIEMQARRHAAYPERILYYLSRMYAEQLEPGDGYEKLNSVIGIHFLDYEEFPDHKKKFHFCFELRDRDKSDLRLTEHICIHIFELPKLKRSKAREQISARMASFFQQCPCRRREENERTLCQPFDSESFQCIGNIEFGQ